MNENQKSDAAFSGRVVALSGGVGGAKLARGLAAILPREQLSIVANTADDFDYWGLRICPDLDSVMYALADLNDTQRGWGLQDESWRALDAMRRLGGEDWFQLGDQDLATHIQRSDRLHQGRSLAEVSEALCRALGVTAELLPMSEQRVATWVHSDSGPLAFQEYFVRERCRPAVKHLEYRGIETAQLHPRIRQHLADPALAAIILCPSNPFLSLDPILQLPGCTMALKQAGVPIIAVSPIVAGLAIKGPAAKMMAEMAMPVTATAVARHYQERYDGLLDGFVIDSSDAALAGEVRTLGLELAVCPTVMTDLHNKVALAQFCLRFAGQLAK